MRRFRPIHGFLLVALLMTATLAAQRLLSSGRGDAIRVSPDASGIVTVPVGDLAPSEVRFYRFLNRGNQEVRFLLGRDPQGTVVAAFDASENDFKRHRGFRHEGEWLVNNKCDSSFRLTEINSQPSGCAPVPVKFARDGDRLVLAEGDILAGWRFFR